MSTTNTYTVVNKAFSKQSVHYDADDTSNPVLQDLRQQVYNHVDKFIRPKSNILELNAGTGIDAVRFVKAGHNVHATDLSDGMISQIENKIKTLSFQNRLTCQQVSYDNLSAVNHKKFDYVFSNFGGLNCIQDLSLVTRHLPGLLNDGACVTFVIMPSVCLWELLWSLKGNIRAALRRFNKNGVMAHLEGEYFKTFYHALSPTKKAFGKQFELIETEGLATLSPPPASYQLSKKYPSFYRLTRKIDSALRHTYPFNRWGDHIIVTLRYNTTILKS